MGETNNAILKEDLGLKYPKIDSIRKARYGLFICGWCGAEFEAQIGNVRHQPHTSCGCRAGNPTHGLTKNKHFGAWRGMMVRCYKPSSKAYKNYGGRGISMCEEWRNNFMAFYDWSMANGYQDSLTIDRINNDGNYEPSNCRWTNSTIQACNKRILISTNTSGYKGVTKIRYKKWRSVISIKRKSIHLGCFDTALEAGFTYDKYVIENNLPHTTNGLYSRQGD